MRFTQTLISQSQDLAHRFTDQDFDLAFWRAQKDSQALSGGRGASQKIHLHGEDFVLRHYLRGGLVARLLTDQYLWLGLQLSRPFKEAYIVERAIQMHLPVPQVVAYRIERSGLFYRAAIISRYIENRGTLAACLHRSTLERARWFMLGQLISSLHQAGIYHADLNANNILLDKRDGFYLIDFDKARRISPGSPEAQRNLQRLLRSLNKIAENSSKKFHFSKADWSALLAGYELV